jgi:hypothetical protein
MYDHQELAGTHFGMVTDTRSEWTTCQYVCGTPCFVELRSTQEESYTNGVGVGVRKKFVGYE